MFDEEGGEPARWKDGPEGDEEPTLVHAEREMPATMKMLMVSLATRSAMHPSTKRPLSSIMVEIPPTMEQPLARADWVKRRGWIKS